MKRTLGKYFPGVVLIALVSIFTPTTAFASVTAAAPNTTPQSITSATFKVAPEASISGSTTTAYLTPTTTSNSQIIKVYFVNFGTININAFDYSTALASGSGSYTLTQCPVNQTFTTPTTCSSGVTNSLASSGTGPALTVGQWVPIEITIAKKTSAVTVSSTVSSTVSNYQIRAGTKTVA